MTEQRTFVLDRKALLKHRSGHVLALASSAVGRSFAVVGGPVQPSHRRIGRQADSMPKRPRSVIAVVDVFGPLAQRAETFCGYIDGYDSIAERISGELAKPEVGAVLVRIDSPGGDAAGIEEAIRSIVEARTASGKPIATYVDEMAASAGYWLASGISDAGIYAPRSAQVGSVGCWSMIVDERKALENEGISVTVVREPAGKDAANPYSPVLDVAVERESQVVTAIAERFYAAVGKARGLPPDRVRAFDAAMFLADQAKVAGLVDEVVSINDAIARLATKAVESNRARTSARSSRRAFMGKEKHQAADGMPPAEGQPAESGRATAADVSQACTDCAQACTDCATACDSGTADEAIAATESTIAACEECIKKCKSFLGASDSDKPEESKPEPEPKPAGPDGQQSASSTDARVISLLESIEAERAEERRARQAAAEAEERKKLLASRKIVNKEVRAWLENPKTSIQSVRDACRVLPPAEVPNLAGDVTPDVTRGAGSSGLDERELKICKEMGCKPEDFAALKAQREAAKAARS